MSEQDQTRRGHRSSSFPFIGLAVAIDRARQLHAQEGRNSMRREVAAQHWSYSPKSSPGRQTLGALAAYGLLEKPAAGKVRLTERALAIVMEGSPPAERERAIRAAALAPDAHREMWEKHRKHGRPPSESSLVFELHKDRHLSEAAAKAAAREYLGTADFAGLFESGILPEEGENSGHEQERPSMETQTMPASSAAPARLPTTPAAPISTAAGEVLRYRLSKDCTVEVAFSGAITQSAIDKLRAHLDLSKDTYPENGEVN